LVTLEPVILGATRGKQRQHKKKGKKKKRQKYEKEKEQRRKKEQPRPSPAFPSKLPRTTKPTMTITMIMEM
jgi:hypothetical protein